MPPKPKIGVRVRSAKTEYEFQELLNEGDMSWALRALDCHSGKTVFLKYYKSPTPAVDWYQRYLNYVTELNRRLEEGAAAQYCVLCTDQFKANPRPGSLNKTEYFFQVYDFIEKGLDLKGMLEKNLDWEKRKAITKVFLVCMRKIHEAGIVHCDLKPENIQMMPVKGTALGLIPRLIDMDRSILRDKAAPWITGQNKEGYTGTPSYFSPEHLSGKTPQTSSDVFTVGIILCELLAGKHPFGTYLEDKNEYKKAVLAGNKFTPVKLIGEIGDSTEKTAQYASLIAQCFSKEPGQRPTCEHLHKKLLELDRKSSSTLPVLPPSQPSIDDPLPPTTTGEEPPSPANVSSALVLTGNAGAHTIRLPMTLGKMLLTKASNQANYAGPQQFKLEKGNQGWFIIPGTDTRFPATILNGAVLKGRTLLKDGDKLCLQGRNSGKQAMELTVSFEM